MAISEKINFIDESTDGDAKMTVFVNDKNRLFISCDWKDDEYMSAFCTLSKQDVAELIKFLNKVKGGLE
jgi:hypothetical protein